jgi:hypothetical protein
MIAAAMTLHGLRNSGFPRIIHGNLSDVFLCIPHAEPPAGAERSASEQSFSSSGGALRKFEMKTSIP